MVLFFSFRWTQGRGHPVNQYYNNWDSCDENEPDLLEFDYEGRKYSPLKKSIVTKCTPDPAFDCFVGGFDCKRQYVQWYYA